MKPPTQKDVARLAGVSRATVSYVLNGADTGRIPISNETRLRVMEAIEELGYEPDARAQALRSGNTNTIGLVIPNIRNPHFWETAEGVEQSTTDAGYQLLLSNMALRHENVNKIFTDLARRRIDGLILMGAFLLDPALAPETLGRVLKRRLPIVEISDHHPGHFEMDRVTSDYKSASTDAMSYLFELGHRRIGLVYGVDVVELGEDRLEPYRASLEDAGIGVDEELIIKCGSTIEDGYQATLQLLNLSPRPTAIISINDLLAIGVIRAINDAGLSIPEDISVLSYDDIPMAKYLVPRLTTISKDMVGMAQEAVSLLLARIEDSSLPFQTKRFPTRLNIRESTGPAPSEP